MTKHHTTHHAFKHFVFLTVFVVIFSLGFIAQAGFSQTAFTAHDGLKVKSLQGGTVSDDGRYVAGLVATTKDQRLDIDHYRFGDPTYIAPRKSQLIIIDTNTQKTIFTFKEKAIFRALEWSPDCKSLAFILIANGKQSLQLYDTQKNNLKEIKLKTEKPIAGNAGFMYGSVSFLRWTPDGTGLILSMREKDWEGKSRAIFKEATEGPIVVYDSSEPFLKWEAIHMEAAKIWIGHVTLKTGDVKEILSEGLYVDTRLAKDSKYMTYIQVYPIKTDYTRKGGIEFELRKLNLEELGESKVLIEKKEKYMGFGGSNPLGLVWNETNDQFAWSEKGDIFVQGISEDSARNLTKQEDVKEEGQDEDKEKAENKLEEKKDDEKDRGEDKKEKDKAQFSVVSWSFDGTKILAGSEKGWWIVYPQSGKKEMVYEFPDPKKQKFTHYNDPIPLKFMHWSPDGQFLYLEYSATDKWERGIKRYNLKTRQMSDVIIDSNRYTGWHVSKDGEKFFYQFSDGDLPNDYFVADKSFKTKTRLTDLNPWIKEKKLTQSELVKYLDVDGKELSGILYYPVDYEPGKKYPLICWIYEKFFHNSFNPSMNLIANAGYFGFSPSVNLEIGYPGEAWVRGVTSGVNMLIEKGFVDPKKVGIMGISYGGYATSLIITQTDRFAAAINISGKTNMISFLGDSPRIGTRNYGAAEVGQDRIGATLWESPMKYIAHSAILYCDRVKTPLLLLTGEADWNVTALNSREMYYALRRLGKECVWVNYINAGHGAGLAGNEAEFHDHWKRTFDWFEKYFNTDEKEDEEKKDK
ncbi:alpha/beta hydrolase family protein [Acidobacteriota bacterium]